MIQCHCLGVLETDCGVVAVAIDEHRNHCAEHFGFVVGKGVLYEKLEELMQLHVGNPDGCGKLEPVLLCPAAAVVAGGGYGYDV